MKKRLEGKVAIVTASSDGIGYAIAEAFAQNGARVVISSRNEKNVQNAVQSLAEKGHHVTGCVCHVGKSEDRQRLIQKAIETYGKLDVVVSNAGISPQFGKLLEVSEEVWDKIFDINLKAGFLLAKETMPHLKKTKGSMVFVSSIGGYLTSQMIGAYTISKTAMFGLTKALANECVGDGVRVNCIAPGLIKTKFSSMLTSLPDSEKHLLPRIPMKRAGAPSEVAGAVVFLSSEEASYITGETIVIAGGTHARL